MSYEILRNNKHTCPVCLCNNIQYFPEFKYCLTHETVIDSKNYIRIKCMKCKNISQFTDTTYNVYKLCKLCNINVIESEKYINNLSLIRKKLFNIRYSDDILDEDNGKDLVKIKTYCECIFYLNKNNNYIYIYSKQHNKYIKDYNHEKKYDSYDKYNSIFHHNNEGDLSNFIQLFNISSIDIYNDINLDDKYKLWEDKLDKSLNYKFNKVLYNNYFNEEGIYKKNFFGDLVEINNINDNDNDNDSHFLLF